MNEWWFHLPLAVWVMWVFMVGCACGSFLNVIIARMPYDKSIIWPSSRCFSCYHKISFSDNLPIVGYLRLRGRCRHCGTKFSSKYFWIEVLTGLAFAGLYVLEIVLQNTNWGKPLYYCPGLRYSSFLGTEVIPPWQTWVFFFHHGLLLAILIACAGIDAGHRIIPPLITYSGTVAGIVLSTLLPWPWPNALSTVPELPQFPFPAENWADIRLIGAIPTGVMPYPFMGPPPSWAPAGSPLLGFLNGVIGAAVGMLVGRGIKFMFEVGFGQEALGLGDADLLMCIGAFMGWQVAALALPVGAFVALAVVIPLSVYRFLRRRPVRADLPFGPGIAAGAITTWLLWRWIGELVRIPSFDMIYLGVGVGVMVIGLLVAGLILRR
jgi:leader peptidase (prepilin peptidase)/N-methyltransferase